MTRTSIHEYVAAQRPRYLAAARSTKRRILDEVVAVTGYHRKAALRRLHRPPRATPRAARTGRPRVYGADVAAAAQVLWDASGEIGAVRLQPFVPELLDRLLACGAVRLRPETDAALRRVSAATLKRLLAPARAARPPRGRGITRAGTWLKHQIPIRTFADWDDARPGFLEGDLVAHCGPSALGFYLCTLCAVDIVTSWTELEPVWGKGQERVGSAIHHARQRLPMPLLGWDSDSGSEFINELFWRYCQRESITFTRGRAYRKNDGAHVEQKNGAIVRRWVGYDRYASKAAYAALRVVYRLLRLHVNFFQPVQSSSRASASAAASGASTIAPRRRISASAPPACSRPRRARRSISCIAASTPSSSAASSTPPWSGSGPSPPPRRPFRQESGREPRQLGIPLSAPFTPPLHGRAGNRHL